MKTYSVYLPPDTPESDAPLKTGFLNNGESWPAFLISPAWLLWKGLWQEFFVYMALQTVFYLVDSGGLKVEAIVLSIIPQIYLLLEGNELVRLKHERRGWKQVGTVYGKNIGEAEIRYFSSLPANEKPDTSMGDPPHRQGRPESIGLFPLDDMTVNRKSPA